jgi:hypothetical protein
MSEYPVPPRRPPRKKLKMPLFGNMGSGSSSDGGTDWGVKNFSTLVFVVGTLGLLAQLFLPSLWAEKVYDSASELRSYNWMVPCAKNIPMPRTPMRFITCL